MLLFLQPHPLLLHRAADGPPESEGWQSGLARTLLVLDLGLHVVDCVARLNLQRDRLARQRLHEDLHAAAQAQHEVQRGLWGGEASA